MHHIWFSHKEYVYDARLKDSQKVFYWSNESKVWDWDNCLVSFASIGRDRLRIIVRSSRLVYSKYMKRQVKVRYMYSFTANINSIDEPKEEYYHEPIDRVKGIYGKERRRWVISIDDRYWLWQWANGKSIKDSMIAKIYSMMIAKAYDECYENVFDGIKDEKGRIIPVIYQPAIDSWNNFIREVHCYKVNDKEYEVTILFNNEQLRRFALLNKAYEWFRSIFYGRTIDIESFKIILDDKPRYLTFDGIYSKDHDIIDDNIHHTARNVRIRYYYSSINHPIIFINTANHAMAEYDNNPRLWKWEYIPYLSDAPVILGNKSRKDIEARFKARLRFL